MLERTGIGAEAKNVFTCLSLEIAERISDGGVSARLGRLAEAVASLSGVSGALAVGCDQEGQPLRLCAASLALRSKERAFATLGEICSAAQENEPWFSVPRGYFETSEAATIRARLVEDRASPTGMICVGFGPDTDTGPILEALEKSLPHFSWAIQVDRQLEKMRLYKALRSLEIDELGRKGRPDPLRIAKRLKAVYQAAAVTILFREQKSLYPAATTELKISEEGLAGEQEESLTQYVFRTATALRLRNAHDVEEVRLETQGECERETLSYREVASRSGDPVRLLAVPMVSDARARGVIRVFRGEEAAPFTAAEQETLQHFGHLLGLAMHSAWRLFLADNISGPATEAICITRNEQEMGQTVPRVVHTEAGCEVIFNRKRESLDRLDARQLYAKGEYAKVRKILREALREGRRVVGPVRTRGRRFGKPKDDVRTLDISYRLVASPFARPVVHYTIAVVRDVTEDQIKAEQHSRIINLLDKKGLAYFRADKDGVTVETSPTECRLTEYSQQEIVGMPRVRLWEVPRARSKFIEDIKKGGGELVNSMQRIRKKGGDVFMSEAAVHLLKNEAGKSIGYEGLYEDVEERVKLQGFLDLDTDRVLAEHELYVRLLKNQSMNLLFLTSLAHQLRSPLGALVEQLRNFQEGITDATQFSGRLKYTIGQARVSALFVANLTHMDMILRGEPFEFSYVNLAKLAIETKLDFIHLCAGRNIRISVDGSSIDKYVSAFGHQNLLRQVFVNLIDNAIKYSDPETEIVIRGCHDEKGRYLEVSNQGLSVQGENRKLIFDRGFRLGEAEALVPAGTGLGLWLVRKIIEAHYALIECDNLNEGDAERTAFRIFFPSRDEIRKMERRKGR